MLTAIVVVVVLAGIEVSRAHAVGGLGREHRAVVTAGATPTHATHVAPIVVVPTGLGIAHAHRAGGSGREHHDRTNSG